jgi:hypothetical protein
MRRARGPGTRSKFPRDAQRSTPDSLPSLLTRVQRTVGNRATCDLVARLRPLVIQRDWVQQQGRWDWANQGTVPMFTGRPLLKPAPERFNQPVEEPVLKWSSEQRRYVATGFRFRTVVVNLAEDEERSNQAERIGAAVQTLGVWRTFANDHTTLSPTVYPELALMADNIAQDLRGQDGYAALTYLADAEDELMGVCTYEVVHPEDREERMGGAAAHLGEVIPANYPVLYASHSVARPSTQTQHHTEGDVGGVGSAMRRMREWQAAELRLPTFSWASNPRSYLQNLRTGFDDIGPPVQGVFPPPPEVVARA